MQALLVTLIVSVAIVYAVWRLSPAAWRHGAARTLAGWARRGGASDRAARQLERRVATPAGGCGDCDGCRRCPSPPPAD